MSDVLLLVDVLTNFSHGDGDAMRASFKQRAPALGNLIRDCRARGIPIVYANDHFGDWTAERSAMIEQAKASGAYDDVEVVLPQPDEPIIIKPRYSAFDRTPLAILLEQLGPDRLLLAGAALEMCVTQTAIAAREHGYKVTVMVDACAEVDRSNAEAALAYLERVVGAWLESAAGR